MLAAPAYPLVGVSVGIFLLQVSFVANYAPVQSGLPLYMDADLLYS